MAGRQPSYKMRNTIGDPAGAEAARFSSLSLSYHSAPATSSPQSGTLSLSLSLCNFCWNFRFGFEDAVNKNLVDFLENLELYLGMRI